MEILAGAGAGMCMKKLKITCIVECKMFTLKDMHHSVLTPMLASLAQASSILNSFSYAHCQMTRNDQGSPCVTHYLKSSIANALHKLSLTTRQSTSEC